MGFFNTLLHAGDIIKLRTAAEDNDDPHAALKLAKMYFTGDIVSKNIENAYNAISLAELNDPLDDEYFTEEVKKWSEVITSAYWDSRLGIE